MKTRVYQREVHYYECDGMDITHHSNYIRFMEEARIDWMDQLGYGFDKMEAEGVVSPVVGLTCDYKHSTRFKDLIEIELSVASMSRLKLTFSYVMRVGEKVVCTATSTHCFMENGRPVSLETRFPAFYALITE